MQSSFSSVIDYIYGKVIKFTGKVKFSKKKILKGQTFINCCRVDCETWRFVTRDDVSHEGRRPECENVNRV